MRRQPRRLQKLISSFAAPVHHRQSVGIRDAELLATAAYANSKKVQAQHRNDAAPVILTWPPVHPWSAGEIFRLSRAGAV